ncbi:hypothetical protein [Halomonas alkalisoli]|uniref:hypothetical protein n=1 Tax=Halomonas alkalisoli TaxID=2907158 RepID=UPI001F249960|nr:hypothetical protein [Halomonas alkalisoli]MCE9681973.1 hypothetical protein [Halomonas alkalisoli]
MNKDQVKDSSSKDKATATEVADDTRTEKKGKVENHGDKDGSVLGKINDDAKKEKK